MIEEHSFRHLLEDLDIWQSLNAAISMMHDPTLLC
jgi:hypothetical protein